MSTYSSLRDNLSVALDRLLMTFADVLNTMLIPQGRQPPFSTHHANPVKPRELPDIAPYSEGENCYCYF